MTQTQSVKVPQGTIHYRDSGSGEPIVFVHAALDLDRVTLVANDTGGAIAQIAAAHHPERIGRLVLTPCDTHENFLPPMYRYLQVAARIPGALNLLMQALRFPPLRRLPFAFGRLTKAPVDREIVDAWLEPIVSDREVRRDAAKFLRGIDKRQTIEAAEQLKRFDRPVLVAFAPEDRFFRLSDGERLARDIPNGRLERIENSYSFAPEDQPERVAELVRAFVSEDRGRRSS